jgi:hypothetical protein
MFLVSEARHGVVGLGLEPALHARHNASQDVRPTATFRECAYQSGYEYGFA